MSQVGMRVRELRKRRKWTLEDLSEMTGISYGMIGHIERGDREGKPDVLKKIAAAFEIPYGILIRYEREDHP